MGSGWIALIGVGVGAVLAGGFSLLKDAIQWRREHRVRYSQQRMDAYADFLAKTTTFTHYEPQMYHGIVTFGGPATPNPQREFHIAYELVQMVASEPVRKAATFYAAAAENYWSAARSEETPARGANIESSGETLFEAKEGFYEAIRKERGTD